MNTNQGCARCGATPAEAMQGLCPRCLLEVGIGTHAGGVKPDTRGTPPPPTPAEMAKHFPQLEILECLGRGGMGMVYKARQAKLNRIVALKVLSSEKGADPRFAERFLREAQALARLDHPNIVRVHEFGETDGLYYLVMEYVDGLTLRQVLREGRLAPEEALAIVPRICEALQFAHGKGVVHRDIKPENVLLDREGRVKIADFGIAKLLGTETGRANLTAEQQVIGTPHYMAPEQVETPQRVDHRADIYSLGVVFYELLTGELPLGKFPLPSRRVRVDVRLDDVVLRALEKEPERRYQQAGEVQTAVENIAASPRLGAEAVAPPMEAIPTLVPLPYRMAAKIGLGICLLVLLVSATVTWLLPRSYSSVARLELDKPSGGPRDPFWMQTEFEKMRSSTVLRGVAERLGLVERWSKRFGKGKTLAEHEVIALLRPMLSVESGRGTALAALRVFSTNREEAAEIANAVAEGYLAAAPSKQAVLVDRAEPALRPSRPNVGLNLALGAGAGLLLGGLAALLVLGPGLFRGAMRPQPRPSGQSRLALGLFLAGTLGTLGLMTVSPRHEMALIFGGVALFLACVFGWMNRHESLGRGVIAAVVLLLGAGGLVLAILAGVLYPLGRQRAAAQAEQAAQRERAMLELARERVAKDAAGQLKAEGAGTVSGAVPKRPSGGMLSVRKDGSGTHATIQAAIEAASPGAVIEVGAGRFEENLMIAKAVTLQGSGVDQTVIGLVEPWAEATASELKALQEQVSQTGSDGERKRRVEEARARVFPSVLRIQGASDVRVVGIRFTRAGAPRDGQLVPMTAIEVNGSSVTFSNIAVVGSPGNGLVIRGGSAVVVERSLVAAVWNTGVVVERGESSRVRITDSDVRNCYYAGITIGRGQSDVQVERCRIAGAAWHGVRYDDASPLIRGNLVFGNARCGIYASGRTSARVEGNVFLANEMNGMSCWFNNRDTVAGNTFVNNLREGVSVLGASSPVIQSNIFSGHGVALYQGQINASGAGAALTGNPVLLANVFWSNGTNWVRVAGDKAEVTVLSAEQRSQELDPKFVQPEQRDFRLQAGSPALEQGLGAIQPLGFASPWMLQEEEKAMIPEGATRDSRQWRRPGGL